MITYTGLCPNKDELELVSMVKPWNVLISYYYWQKKDMNELIETIGYLPVILLDSGAFTAMTKKKPINIDSYMQYIEKYSKFFEGYFALDVIKDSVKSIDNYEYMKEKGYKPFPVYHYGEDISVLIYYLKDKPRLIGLGGFARGISDKNVFSFIDSIVEISGEQKFHLLGKSNKRYVKRFPDLYSSDSSRWIQTAGFGNPRRINITGIKNRDRYWKAYYNLIKDKFSQPVTIVFND